MIDLILDKKMPMATEACNKVGTPPNRNRVWRKPVDDSDPRSMAQFFKDMNSIISRKPRKHDGRGSAKASL